MELVLVAFALVESLRRYALPSFQVLGSCSKRDSDATVTAALSYLGDLPDVGRQPLAATRRLVLIDGPAHDRTPPTPRFAVCPHEVAGMLVRCRRSDRSNADHDPGSRPPDDPIRRHHRAPPSSANSVLRTTGVMYVSSASVQTVEPQPRLKITTPTTHPSAQLPTLSLPTAVPMDCAPHTERSVMPHAGDHEAKPGPRLASGATCRAGWYRIAKAHVSLKGLADISLYLGSEVGTETFQ